MTGGTIFVECLKAQGVEVIFGLPGNHLDTVYEALYNNQESIRHYVTRHEGGAAFMADGYARATGDVGVCMTVPGPGSNNAAIGICEAYTACSPVLLITGQNPSYLAQKDPRKSFHGLDQQAAFAPMTKHIEIVRRVDQIPDAVNRAFSALRSGRPGPVLMELATDALQADAELPIPPRNNGVQTMASPEDVDAAMALISSSERPLIVSGGGINHTRATEELLEFAHLLDAPVAMTGMGKGAVPEDSPYSIGLFRDGVAQAAMKVSDLIIAIGTRFTYRDTGNWSLQIPQPLIHIEADVSEIHKEYPATVGIGANPKLVLQQLNDALGGEKLTGGWGANLLQLHRQFASIESPRILKEMRDVMPRDAILSVDVNITGYGALPHFPTYSAGSFIFSGISVAMGIGLTAAIGAQVAYPDRKVVALSGDGEFLMTSPDLATAVMYDLPIVTLVMNDNQYTSIERGQLRRFGKRIGVELVNPDFVQFAESFGAIGLRVEDMDDFRPTLEKTLALDKPVIIEVIK
ncbi:MAG: thiamine pyrophosphate-binding protein [Candidatus Poribacteria bacterium]|nr:thiamine pyrophosphate-binding protein [Candidatus Poribacteria bacterium]